MSDADLRDISLYTVPESAAMLRMPEGTLRAWVSERAEGPEGAGTPPLIQLPAPDALELSFSNLIEAWVLRALRSRHRVKMSGIRNALAYVKEELGIDRLLLHPDLLVSPGNLFLERYGKLINLNRAGQLAMRKLLEAHLKRVLYDDENVPLRFFPVTREDLTDSPKRIVVDPRFSFGRAMTEHGGIGTSTIVARFGAGESVSALADDYGLPAEEIEEAIRYEQAIAA